MYRRMVTSVLVVLFAGLLFSSVFSVFSNSLNSLQTNLETAAQTSLLAY